METQSIRLRLVFEDGSLLSEAQRSDGMNQSWLLVEPNQHQKISDVCNHLLHSFNLRDSCPNGILLYMDGFVLPPSESTRILKDKEILCVKRKEMGLAEAIEGGDAGNLVDYVEVNRKEPVSNAMLLLPNEEEKLEDESSSVETVSKKRKLQSSNHRVSGVEGEVVRLLSQMDSSSSSSSSDFAYSSYWHLSSSSSSEDVSSSNTYVCNSHVLSTIAQATFLLFHDTASSSEPINTTTIDREASHDRLVQDYFGENPVYGDEIFKKGFRMRRELFLRIVDDMEREFPYFRLSWDARGKRGFSPLQKCISAICQLAYGTIPNEYNEYLSLSERTSRESLQNFCTSIIQLYGQEYLRKPSVSDIQLLYAAHESKYGFPGMLGTIGYTHWTWRNCPTVWRGQYMRGDLEFPTIMLEAVVSQDLWIWHAFFDVAGSNNDINVLNQWPLFNEEVNGTASTCPFQVNKVKYKHGYYLADEIYPNWATFVKAFTYLDDDKRKKFNATHESARRDLEQIFGVLKSSWRVFRNPARAMDPRKIKNTMYACIILHNMILKDEGLAICPFLENDRPTDQKGLKVNQDTIEELRCQETHNNLRLDIVEHIVNTCVPNLDY
ncbi:uncharacterized protein LOC111916960 isoform X1 [Lactuca sativa]|uniref:uncharacterized protein LOC111916960 isoform X1 n=1 Tax=Lactuca sativa TaxID=4236 RepID=UPI000CD8AC94|nr:uncharacterized protein LOC111916960 isoform X1 [Lactuca sativa]